MLAVAWRNLWRNARRTWLTAGAIAFAIALVVFGMSFQFGGYAQMIENSTALLTGHLQIQNRAYLDQARIDQSIDGVESLLVRLQEQPGLASVAPRVEAFALVSADERSFGARVLGVDVAAERRTVRFFDRVARGRMMAAADEAVVGETLARNLGVDLGGELVLLGSGKEGGVAVLALDVVGIFRTGQPAIDRAMLAAPLASVQDAFGLHDTAHTLVVRADRVADSARLAAALNGWLGEPLIARDWPELLPEVRQSIDVDRISAWFVFGILIVVVTFSVVNAFIMTVFERTREFGMLRAIGMPPGRIVGMVQIEAACVWALGTLLGLALTVPVVSWLGASGVYLGDELHELAETMYLPDRLYPALAPEVLVGIPAVMLAGTQIAALIPSLRIRRLQPVEALRAE